VEKLYVLPLVLVIVIFIGSIGIFYIESPYENSKINSFLDAIWWTVATLTTVGYGDVIPVTDAGKIMAIFFMLFAIGFLLIFLSVIGTRFYKRRIEPKEQEISHAQKLILGRIDDLEKSIKEIRDSLKQNS
jgi:voltage-gated potassium channel